MLKPLLWELDNTPARHDLGRIYWVISLSIFFRPEVGSLLPRFQELSSISIEFLFYSFFILGVYLRFTPKIHLLTYVIVGLVPLGFFSGYIIFFSLSMLNSSLIIVAFNIIIWFSILRNLRHTFLIEEARR